MARAFFGSGSGDPRCESNAEVQVTADPTVADAVKKAARDFRAEEKCAEITVDAKASGKAASALVENEVDLWIPDSTLWRSKLSDPEAVTSVGSIASTPLVAVLPRPAAEKLGWPDEEFSWGTALESDGASAIADPSNTSEGILSLVAVRTVMGSDAEATEVVGAMSKVAGATVPSIDEAYASIGTENGATMVAATEQSVVEHNKSDPKVPVAAMYPSEGTLSLDYPALVVDSAPNAGIASEFGEYLAKHQDAIRDAGYRDRNNEIGANQDLGVLTKAPQMLPMPSAEEVQALRQQWAALSLEMRMLAVVDVSGSMNESNEEGVTRIEQTKDAAQTALALLRPEDSSVGLWAFSTLMDAENGNDYIPLVDVGPLTDDVDGNTRQEALYGAAGTLPDLVDQGGTALYDTTLAAFLAMENDYEQGSVNSVVIMTDGVNEDDLDSIALEDLLTQLQASFDPSKPVSVIMIGIGAGVDMEILQQISQTTGTKAYHADNASDIENVFLQAMIERKCRPNC